MTQQTLWAPPATSHWETASDGCGQIPVHDECGGEIKEIDSAYRTNGIRRDEETGLITSFTGDPWDWETERFECDTCESHDVSLPGDDTIDEWE